MLAEKKLFEDLEAKLNKTALASFGRAVPTPALLV